MVTGRTAFQGKSQVTLISSIVSSQPEKPSAIRVEVPRQLDHIVSRCLEKQADARWQTASDLMLEMKWVTQEGPPIVMAVRSSQVKARIWMATAAILAVAFMVLGYFYVRIKTPESIPMRLAVLPPENTGGFVTGSGAAPWPTLSPDGRRLVFGAVRKDGVEQLSLRSLDNETAQPLNGTEDAQQPFWSPDGRYIAFFTENRLKKIDIAGGVPQTICSTPGNVREGTWGADDMIVFALSNTGLARVPAAGGQPQAITELDQSRSEVGHLYPHFLPDGRHFVFLAQTKDSSKSSISIGSLDSREIKRLITTNSKAEYADPGYSLDDRKAHPLAESRFAETEARFSPDGKWIVYTSNESGRYEVYARSFPSNENKIQISTNRGAKGRWRHDGKEIFCMANDDKLMAVSVSGDTRLEAKPAEPLFAHHLNLSATSFVVTGASHTMSQPMANAFWF
jgi:hypothetical protein